MGIQVDQIIQIKIRFIATLSIIQLYSKRHLTFFFLIQHRKLL